VTSQLLTDEKIDFDSYAIPKNEGAHVKPVSDWADEIINKEHVEYSRRGASSPWSKIDSHLRFLRGHYTVWAGYNDHGKSALVSDVMLHLAAQGEKICIASLEISSEELILRMIRQACVVEVPTREQKRNFFDWSRGKIWIYDQQGKVSTTRIMGVANYTHQVLGINHFVIDNLTCCGIPEDGATALTEQGEFVEQLASHAHHTGQSVHLVAHVRKPDDEAKQPHRYSIRGAGKITDLAHNVYMVWRNTPKETACEEGLDKHKNEPDCLLIVDKNRSGGWRGKIKLWFNIKAMRFMQYEGYPEVIE